MGGTSGWKYYLSTLVHLYPEPVDIAGKSWHGERETIDHDVHQSSVTSLANTEIDKIYFVSKVVECM